jgi:glucose-1-phosphate cytidylyltransferase
MKVVILAGGLGTRLSEETHAVPKPMVQIGGRPILWHIMKNLSAYGMNDFIICCGYKGYVIKEYFANYYLHMCDITFDLVDRKVDIHQNNAEKWRVTLVDTGEDTATGGRLRRVRDYLGEESFLMTYGDGLAAVDVPALVKLHQEQRTLATVTATQPPGRWGVLEIANARVRSFREKVTSDTEWINGGFFVLSPKVIDYIEGDATAWEREPLERLAKENQLSAYRHVGFWHPMDTLRDKMLLEDLWRSGKAPWKSWS